MCARVCVCGCVWCTHLLFGGEAAGHGALEVVGLVYGQVAREQVLHHHKVVRRCLRVSSQRTICENRASCRWSCHACVMRVFVLLRVPWLGQYRVRRIG
jgi:hypothetical protein